MSVVFPPMYFVMKIQEEEWLGLELLGMRSWVRFGLGLDRVWDRVSKVLGSGRF